MTLQDTFEAHEFGPLRDDKWEDQDDFSSVSTQQAPVPFDNIRPQVVAEARAQIEQVYIDIQHQADEDKL